MNILLVAPFPLKIAGFRREGYESDPNKDYLEVIDRMTMEDILRFY